MESGIPRVFCSESNPKPIYLKNLQEYNMGCDCSSYTELMLAKSCGFDGKHIMFSSNDTPAEEFAYADELGAIINLDDFTHIDFLEETIGHIPETISCRYNPYHIPVKFLKYMGLGLLSLQNTRGIPDSMQKLPLLFLHSHECL